jgi:hypothetical protein
MRNNLITANQKKPPAPNEVLKATALVYLKDALIKEEFEQCPELIQKAQYFGADKTEVQKVIAEFIKEAKLTPYFVPKKNRVKGRF